jgi:hypothetical protein
MKNSSLVTCVAAIALLAMRTPLCVGADAEKPKASITAPAANADVSQSDEIEGEVTGGWPVVLVKPAAGEADWWIQAAVNTVDDGKFSAQCQFGDDKTPAGTKFKCIIVVVKDKKAAAEFKRGEKRNSLPAGLPRSTQLTVSRAKE